MSCGVFLKSAQSFGFAIRLVSSTRASNDLLDRRLVGGSLSYDSTTSLYQLIVILVIYSVVMSGWL